MAMGSFVSVSQHQLVPAMLFNHAPQLVANTFETRHSSVESLPEFAGSASCHDSASDALLMEHLPMVRHVARGIHARLPQHVDLEELVSAGTLGLIDAVAKFRQDKNAQFKTYAQFRIRGAILDSLRSTDWSPRELRRQGREVEEAIRSVTHRFGRTPSDAEIAAEMRVTLKQYQDLLANLKNLEIGSLNVERGEESGEEELAYVAAPADEDPLFCCLKAEMKQHLIDAIEALPERERLVLTLFYYEELTLKEISEVLGVGESRVSQIRSSAVVRVRATMSAFATQPKGNR